MFAIDFDGTVADMGAAKAAWIAREAGERLHPWECDRTSCIARIGEDVSALHSTHGTSKIELALDRGLKWLVDAAARHLGGGPRDHGDSERLTQVAATSTTAPPTSVRGVGRSPRRTTASATP